MKTYHIYTDASIGRKNEQYSVCGVIVVDSHILDIYYKLRPKRIKSTSVERGATIESVNYIIKNYSTENIIVHSDCRQAMSTPYKKVIFKFVKSHTKAIGFKYKYNNLADWICKNGLDNWRNQWYNNIL